MVPLHQIAKDQNATVSSVTDLDRAETLVGALILPHPPSIEELPQTYITLATRGGRIKRIAVADLVSAASRGVAVAMGVEQGDQLAWVVETDGNNELLLVTRQGKAIRFAEEDVRPMGLSAAGVWAIKLGKDDALAGMGVAGDRTDVILFTEKGYAKRTTAKSFPTQKRYGGGVQATKISSRTGQVAVATLALQNRSLVLLTSKGRVSKLPVKVIQAVGRAAAGSKSRQDTKQPYLDLAKNGPPVLLTVLAGTKTEAKRSRKR